jgi:hypothetical protein
METEAAAICMKDATRAGKGSLKNRGDIVVRLQDEKYKGYEIVFEKDPTGMVAGRVSSMGMFQGWEMGQTKDEAFARIKNNIDWIERNPGKGYNFIDAKHKNHDPAKSEAKRMLSAPSVRGDWEKKVIDDYGNGAMRYEFVHAP